MMRRSIHWLALVVVLAGSGCVVRPSVQIKPFDSATPEPNATVSYAGFWDAMAHWDPSYVRDHPVSEDERRYADALDHLDRGDVEQGLTIAQELYRNTSDPTVRKNARKLLNTVHFGQGRWDLLILPEPNEALSESDRKAKELGEQLRRLPRQEAEFAQPISRMQAERREGLLFLPVRINGQPRRLALDSGADLTVLASDVAGACGVELAPDFSYQARTINGHVAAQLGRIERLDVGGLTLRSHPVLVLPQEEVFTRSSRADGVLGRPALRSMDLQIDYDTSMVTFRKPERAQGVPANLLPVHDLVLKARTPDGIPALMSFDTGSFLTFLYTDSLPYLHLKPGLRARYTAGTFGSQKSSVAGIVPALSLVLDAALIQWENVLTTSAFDTDPLPVSPAGLLGTDIFQHGGHVRIDWLNLRADFWWDGINAPARGPATDDR